MNKKNILSMLLLLLSIGMKAQINIIDLNAVFQTDSIDQARLVVQYEMKYVKDTTNEKQLLDPLKETLMLEIGQKASKCYSYTFYQRDSVLTADYKAGASQETHHGAGIRPGEAAFIPRSCQQVRQGRSRDPSP